MEWPESASGCKEHPNNKQVTGVCSYCLRDKLSQLYVDPTIKASDPHSYRKPCSASSVSASPLQYSSSAASSNIYGCQADYYGRRHFRNASDHVVHSISAASMFISFNNNNNGLMKKNRSTAFASRSRRVRDRDTVNGSNWGRKKDGFWSKLLKLTKGTKENSVHSTTRRQGRG